MPPNTPAFAACHSRAFHAVRCVSARLRQGSFRLSPHQHVQSSHHWARVRPPSRSANIFCTSQASAYLRPGLCLRPPDPTVLVVSTVVSSIVVTMGRVLPAFCLMLASISGQGSARVAALCPPSGMVVCLVWALPAFLHVVSLGWALPVLRGAQRSTMLLA